MAKQCIRDIISSMTSLESNCSFPTSEIMVISHPNCLNKCENKPNPTLLSLSL